MLPLLPISLFTSPVDGQEDAGEPCPSHLDPEKSEHYKQVVAEAVRQMERYVEQPTPQTTNPLWRL